MLSFQPTAVKSVALIIVLLVLVAVAVLNSPATSDDSSNAPLVTFRPDRSQYLSTESASGTLTIKNTTSDEIGYSPVGGAFLIRRPDGSQFEDRWVKSIGRIMLPFPIQPGQSFTSSISLPSCEVISDPCTERVAIKLELDSKTQHLAPIITPEFTYTFVPDPNATFRVDGLRDNRPVVIAPTQTHDADAVARFLNADPLDGAHGLSGDDTDSSVFVGARPIAYIPQPFGIVPATGEYFGGRWEYIGPPSESLTVAADRPEIFALVGLKKERCQRFGYDCETVGVVRAMQRARLLARALGVDIRYLSLVTLYPNNNWEGHDTLVPVGVALTMTGENSATWRRLPTPTPEPSGHVTSGMLPAPRSSPFAGYRRTPAPDPVPIVVRDDATTVIGLGQISRTFTADLLRVDITIDAIDSNQSSGQKVADPLAVAGMLREQPNVADAAGQAEGVGQLPAAYELLLKTYDKAAVNRLVIMLRKVYGALPIRIRYNTSPAIGNCDSVYTASTRAAMKAAVDSAHQARRRLRRLLLAVAYPLMAEQQCEQGAQLNVGELATYNDRLRLPTDRTVMVGARVKLVFRTYK